MIGVALDVTDRKHAEAVVRENEEWLRLLIGNVREYALRCWAGSHRAFLRRRTRTPTCSRGRCQESAAASRQEDERWMVRRDGTRCTTRPTAADCGGI